jgi:hypothetical protein
MALIGPKAMSDLGSAKRGIADMPALPTKPVFEYAPWRVDS